jgi:hypothetical protein
MLSIIDKKNERNGEDMNAFFSVTNAAIKDAVKVLVNVRMEDIKEI